MNNILKYNLLAILVYNLLAVLFLKDGAVFALMFIVALHVFINFMLSLIFYFVNKDSEKSKHFLLSMFIVLGIGFGACIGTTSITGFNMH